MWTAVACPIQLLGTQLSSSRYTYSVEVSSFFFDLGGGANCAIAVYHDAWCPRREWMKLDEDVIRPKGRSATMWVLSPINITIFASFFAHTDESAVLLLMYSQVTVLDFFLFSLLSFEATQYKESRLAGRNTRVRPYFEAEWRECWGEWNVMIIGSLGANVLVV